MNSVLHSTLTYFYFCKFSYSSAAAIDHIGLSHSVCLISRRSVSQLSPCQQPLSFFHFPDIKFPAWLNIQRIQESWGSPWYRVGLPLSLSFLPSVVFAYLCRYLPSWLS